MRTCSLVVLALASATPACGKDAAPSGASSATGPQKAAAQIENDLRNEGLAASVTTRGQRGEVLVLKNLGPKCSAGLLERVSMTPAPGKPTPFSNFARIECETGTGEVIGGEIPFVDVAGAAAREVEKRNQEAEDMTRALAAASDLEFQIAMLDKELAAATAALAAAKDDAARTAAKAKVDTLTAKRSFMQKAAALETTGAAGSSGAPKVDQRCVDNPLDC